MVLGVGTGSTVGKLIDVLKDRKIQLAAAVSSSHQTSDALKAHRRSRRPISMPRAISTLYIDGADEATARGMLIKGGGAALTREKIIAAASRSASSASSMSASWSISSAPFRCPSR